MKLALLGVYRIGLGKPTLAKENLYWTKQASREPDRSVIIYVETASPSKAFEKNILMHRCHQRSWKLVLIATVKSWLMPQLNAGSTENNQVF